LEVFGIKLVGLSAENGRKLLLTLALVFVVLVARAAINALVRLAMRGLLRHPARRRLLGRRPTR
jgi:hypothetical protein